MGYLFGLSEVIYLTYAVFLKGMLMFYGGKSFLRFVENFFYNLKHFRDLFAVVFDTSTTSVEN